MPEYRNMPDLPPPSFPGSHLVIDDRYVFVSGLVAADLAEGRECAGDIRAETAAVMRGLEHMLASVGSGLADIVRVDVHLADLGEIEALDAVYAGFFADRRYPARTCTESARLCGGTRVEITAVARRS